MKELPSHNDVLEKLFLSLKFEKTEELGAKERRILVEKAIARIIGGPESGAKTVTLESGRKITITRGINYSADIDGLSGLQMNDYVPPIQHKTTTSLNIEGYEWYRANNPVAFAVISEFVETKPKKIAVTIKEKKGE